MPMVMTMVNNLLQDIKRILEQHALGDVILTAIGKTLDMTKRMILVDILANDIIKQFGRYSYAVYFARRFCSITAQLFIIGARHDSSRLSTNHVACDLLSFYSL